MQIKYTFEERKKYFTQIEEYLYKNLKFNRFRHSIGVAHTAACLAMRYNIDMDKAYIAGLFHDCAKSLDEEKTIKLCKKYDIPIDNFEKDNIFIIHGKVGAAIAQYEFGIDDEDLLNSIRNHTTGRPGMSLFEKIIYLADYIEANRDVAKDLKAVRALCFIDINAALYRVVYDILKHLETTNSPIDEKSLQTFEFYDKILNEKTKELAFSIDEELK